MFLFDKIAAQEYEYAFDWYDKRSKDAADSFASAVQNIIDLICEHPKRYRNTHKNFREVSLKKYPFSVVYYVDTDKGVIDIISIYHHKKNPKWKFQKTRKK